MQLLKRPTCQSVRDIFTGPGGPSSPPHKVLQVTYGRGRVIEPYQKRQITLGFRVYDVAGLSGHLELVSGRMNELIDLVLRQHFHIPHLASNEVKVITKKVRIR